MYLQSSRSTINPPVPANQKIEQGSQEGQEDDDDHPHKLVVASEIIHQHRDQGQKGQKKDE
jgi:hypothetical protein